MPYAYCMCALINIIKQINPNKLNFLILNLYSNSLD